MRTFSKHAAKPMAVLAAIATLTTGLTCMSNPVAAPKAQADELKPAYATARIVKKADGTGHGTAAQTFVNSKNGFAPGDDSPTDGVVASGDTVEYSLTLNFTAAGKRTINVAFDLSDAPYLEATNGDGFCQPGQLVTAKRNSDGSCSYTVPAGGVETMTQTFYLKAKDTGGVAKSGQIPKIIVKRADGASTTYRSDEITVVSAPAADLVIDNGGNPIEGQYSYERRTYWSENTDATGSFTIRADALTYPGYSSTKGASTSIDWTTKVDISDFPQGTVWTVGGQTVTRNTDKTQYLTVSSGKNGTATSISYRIPAGTDALKNMKEGDVQYYDIHLIPDETVFSVKDENGNALLNMGEGGEPGWNIGRDKSTYSKDTGARVGYPYANNDWSRAIIQRPKPTPAGRIPLFGKGLQRPNTASKTMFDKENLLFKDAEGKMDVYHYYSDGSGDTVSRGTQVKTVLEMYAANTNADQLKNTTPTMQDSWDNTEMKWDGSLTVTQGGTPLSDYTFQWADSKDVWHDGEPSDADAPNVTKVRVILNPDTLTLGQNAPPVQVTFDTLAIADVSKGNVRAEDTLTAWLTGNDKESVTDWVWIAKPVDPTTSIGISLKAYDGEGNQVYDSTRATTTDNSGVLTPGTRVDYTVNEQLRTVLLSNTSMTPTITISKPKGIYNPVCDDPFWQMNVIGDNLVFTPRSGKVTPEVDRIGTANLPDLHFSGTVSNLATGTVTATASMSVDVDENGALRAQTIKSNIASVPFTVSNAETNSGIMRVKTPKAEIGDPLTWEFNVYGKGGGHTGTMDSMLLLPMDGDNKYVQDKLEEYDRGYSNYHGSYKLTEPVTVNMDNSTKTTVYYSTTTGKKSDNPADYEWKTWEQLTAEDKAKVTVIRLTSEVVASDEQMSTSAVNGTITLNPTDNVKDDKYALWLGRNYYSDASGKPAGTQPWPDVAKVVAGSISGTVWWDKDENTLIGDSEERIEGVEVTLSKQDASGNWQTVKTLKTDKNGGYEFDLLHSGTYRTSVKRNTGTSTNDGVQTQVKTYYGKLENVSNTRSWTNKIKSNAKDTSDDIHLGIGFDQKNVDYGYAKPDPKATVDKTVTGTKCNDTKCVINWDVKVQNKGKSTEKAPNVPPLKTFAGGSGHSLALDLDGHLWTWGKNDYGQLGDGTTINQNTPTEIKSDSTFSQVAAGNDHSIALDTNGHLWAWGRNSFGQVGNGTTINVQSTPVEIRPDITFMQIAAGGQHSLALDSNGHLWAWGYNTYCELGDGTDISRHAPKEVEPDTTFTQITAGYFHSLALDSEGHLWAWGKNDYGQVGIGDTYIQKTPVKIKQECKFTQVAAGGYHSLALSENGNLWAWGHNSDGQLGNGLTSDQNTPLKIKTEVTFKQIAVGGYHSLSLDENGNLWSWGYNGDGQLGDSTAVSCIKPKKLETGVILKQITTGYFHSLALDSNGHLWSWGQNKKGQLGNGSSDSQSTPVLVSGDHTWKSGVQTPADTSSESSGTSRFDTSSIVSDRMSSTVHDVTATAGTVSIESGGAKQVATSGDHKFVLTNEGILYAWGNNQYGQLGIAPDTSNTATPTNVSKPTIVNGSWLKVAAGGKHSAAISSDGHLYTTGWNGSGQLGTGDTNNRDQWTLVASDKTFIDVACGNQFTVAIASDGSLWAVGKVVSTSYSTWTQIQSGHTFTQVSANMDTYVTLADDGYSVNGGYSTTTGLTQVAAAFDRAYGLTDAGTVRLLYTLNSDGYAPAVSNLKDITRISGGYNTLYAIDKNQHLWAAGWNGDGQLANGKTGTGRYWTNGSTSGNTDIVSTPIDTGIIASDVAGGDRDVLILGKQVMIAGFDPYGDGKTGGARSTGLKGMAVSSDPTAVPVEPTSETTENGLTTRTYNLPYSIEPGGYVIYHFTGTVDRDTADMTGKDQSYIDEWVKEHTKTILNQTWFDSEHTPYSGTPHANGKTTPNVPDATKLDQNTSDVTGNTTCRTDSDYTEDGRQHWFSTSDEDSCDQVGTVITPTTSAKKLGTISGMYWEDTDKDGIRSDSETKRFANQTVILYDKNGKQVASTKTDKDGAYKFEHLDADGDQYTIQFSRVSHRDFTKPDANDTDKENDASSTDSDASTSDDDYGKATVTITLTQDKPDKTNVDAGVLPETWMMSMPHTGMGLLLPILMLVSILGLVTAIVLLRKEDRK